MAEREWVVMLDIASDLPVADDQADELFGELAEHHAVLSFKGSRITVELLVGATSLTEAIIDGTSVVRQAMIGSGLGRPSFFGASAMTSESHARMVNEPVIPALLGVAEVAKRLGVTKQRVSQYEQIAGFPAPVAKLAAGPVWAEPTLLRFIEEWPRKPGRPRARKQVSA